MNAMLDYARKFIGRPYIWGGDGTTKKDGGFDCSGFALECLTAFGYYDGPDTTADGLRKWCDQHKWFKVENVGKQGLCPGALVFFGSAKATHVAIALDEKLMIEAGGGGSKCVSAGTSTGFVRIRPISGRKDFLCAYERT